MYVHTHTPMHTIYDVVTFLKFQLRNYIAHNVIKLIFFQHLSFPSLHNGSTSFKFSVSSTVDMEGPGGSFECVQQLGSPRGSLELLGTIKHKIRIHANDDVYETTRHRMTVAEENHKNKWYAILFPIILYFLILLLLYCTKLSISGYLLV